MSGVIPTTEVRVLPRQLLALRNFRLLWLGQAISTFGDKFTEIAIPILVYTLSGSAMQLGVAFLVQTLATLIFGLFAGVMTDRWNRQRTMISTNMVRAGLVISILVISVLPLPVNGQLLLLYLVGFCTTAVSQFYVPAKVATIPDTVNDSQLMAANSLDQSTMTLVAFFGYATAGALIGLVGTQTAFLIDGATFLISAALIALMQLSSADQPDNASQRQESIINGIRAGFRHVGSVSILKGIVLLSFIAPLALGGTQALLLIFAQDVLGAGPLGYGLLEGSFGLGIAFGGLVLARRSANVTRGRLLALGVAGMGVGQIFAVLLPGLLIRTGMVNSTLLMAVSLPFFFLGAACNAAVMIGMRTVIQEKTPRDMIGRVFSVIMVVSSAALAAGASTAGLADLYDVELLLALWGVVLTMTGVFAMKWRTFQEK